MSIQPGTHKLGPANATLQVKTGRRGAAAKAGHDLVIEVTAWEATLEVGDSPGEVTLRLRADADSLEVREGTGGVQALGDEDKLEIKRMIDEEVLRGEAIEFRSTEVEALDGDRRLRVDGELSMNGAAHPLGFELDVSPKGVAGSATVRQSDWGIKPYSGLFGALKVKDEVEVVAEAVLAAG
jgi:polyisoprenoid-binding protein YceI